MKIQTSTATKAANIIIDFFSNIDRIDDYFRLRKIERVKNLPPSIPGFGLEDEIFQDYDMPPNDMDIEVTQIDNQTFDALLEKTASFSPDNAPGKQLKLVIKEKKTNTVLGFIKLGSPLINSKPRNNYLGDMPELKTFNKRAIMGFIIVPVQPFGFNYLGGKLLALICCSHKVREMLVEKYDTEFCLFETTSLYGNIKGTSMYDGLKPFLRYKGDTESKFVPTLGEEAYFACKKLVEDDVKEDLIPKYAADGNVTASRKMKITTKMISLIRMELRDTNAELHDKFVAAMKKAEGVTTQKRFYMSDYGYENAKDVLLGKTETLIKGPNYHKHELENIISWWKRKATSRYDKLKSEGRIRKELEVWNADTMNKIDIIR
jgi:hypothetical protein|tara:strand:- start:28 stop:1155 length:1128 start_codon:yes stop_codon:yes gene_type:complete